MEERRPHWTIIFTNGTPSLLYASNNVMMYATVPATVLTWVTTADEYHDHRGVRGQILFPATSDSEFSLIYQWYKSGSAHGHSGGRRDCRQFVHGQHRRGGQWRHVLRRGYHRWG